MTCGAFPVLETNSSWAPINSGVSIIAYGEAVQHRDLHLSGKQPPPPLFFFSFSLLCLAPCYSSKRPFVTLVLSSSYHNFSSASFTFLSLLPCCPHSFCSLPPQFMPVDGGIQQVLGVPASLPLSLLSVQLGSTESCSCASLSVPGWLSQQ